MGEEREFWVGKKKAKAGQEEKRVTLHLLMSPPTVNYNCFSVLIVSVLDYTQRDSSNFLTYLCIINVCKWHVFNKY